jgi:hypothetical protein
MGESDAGKLADTVDRSVQEEGQPLSGKGFPAEAGAEPGDESPAVAIPATTGPGEVPAADRSEAGTASPAGQVEEAAETLAGKDRPAANMSGSVSPKVKAAL